jgi:hypothetical protein
MKTSNAHNQQNNIIKTHYTVPEVKNMDQQMDTASLE